MDKWLCAISGPGGIRGCEGRRRQFQTLNRPNLLARECLPGKRRFKPPLAILREGGVFSGDTSEVGLEAAGLKVSSASIRSGRAPPPR